MNKFINKMKEFEANIEAEVDTVVDWIKNKFKESGAKGAILGMSGGVDCCTVARLLQKADIPVLLVKMPYGRSMDFAGDKKDANELIERFNFDSFTIDITDEVGDVVNNVIRYWNMIDDNNGTLPGYAVVGSDVAFDNISDRMQKFFETIIAYVSYIIKVITRAIEVLPL